MKNNWIFIFVFCLTISTFSQTKPFINFTSDEGLPSSTIYSVYQDKIGLIWIATDIGISRYDGYEFVNYDTNSISDTISSFCEDTSKRLYFKTKHKQLFYVFNDSIHNIKNDEMLNKFEVSKTFNNTEIESILNNKTITSHITDHENSVWVATLNHGLFYFPYLPNVTTFNNKNNKIVKNNETSLSIIKTNLLESSINSNDSLLQIENSDLKYKKINSVYFNNQQIIWYSTNKGLIGINKDTHKTLYKITTKNRIAFKRSNFCS